jgi:2-hydroxychromene-2-carboxylate isomerase
VAIRDTQAERFLEAHHALYEHRHASAGNLRDMQTLLDVVDRVGVDVGAAQREVESGRPLATIRDEHSTFARTHQVWGVPVFIQDEKAVFVRLLDRPNDDSATAQRTIERIIENMSWDSLNEFKHTSVPR